MASSLEVLHSWSCSLLDASFSWKVALLFGMMPAVHVAYCGEYAPVLFFSYLLVNYHVNKDVNDYWTTTIYIYIYLCIHAYTRKELSLFSAASSYCALWRIFAAFFVFVCLRNVCVVFFKRKGSLDLCILAYIHWVEFVPRKQHNLLTQILLWEKVKSERKKTVLQRHSWQPWLRATGTG